MKLMGGKIRKFFLNFNRFNKPAVLAAVFFLIFLGLALPFQFVEALGLIIGTAVAVTIINLVLQLVLVISNLILGLAGVILNWVLSPYFMSLPYTYGGIVDVGWPIVRDFINMFFIIALVIIGLATALRIKEYQAQKTLPLLIIIAILINFTPVICGVILDASNILMNFFLEELTGFKLLGNLFSTQGTMLLGALQHFYNPLESLALIGKTLVMIIFDWVAAFIFFMFSLLFVMRYVMIWVLVIVSPIAFFSRIFPASQRYLFKNILGWDEWWKQFIEWSIIGIVATFFIYLAEQLMVMAPGWIPGIPPGGVWGIITTPLVDFINQLLPWGVMLAFLIIGFFIATSTSAMGAGAITSFFREKGVGMAKAAGRGVTTLAAMGGLRYLGKPAEAIARRLEKVPTPWIGKKGLKGVVSKTLAPGAALTRFAGAQLRRAPAALKERMTSGIGEQEKGMAGKSAETQAAGWNESYQGALATGFGWEKTIGSLRAGIKDGNLGDIQTKLGLSDEEMKARVKRTATEAAKYGKQKEILQTGYLKDKDIEKLIKDARLSPADLEAYGLTVSEEDKKRFAETQVGRDNPIWTKIMTKLKRNQMGHVSKPIALKDEGFAEILHKFGTGEQVGGLADIHGREFLDRFREEVLIRQKANPSWYKNNNPKMHKYLTSSSAQGLGVGLEKDPNVVTSDLRKILKGKPREESIRIGMRIKALKGEIPPAAAAAPEAPDWLVEGLEKIRRGGIPSITSKRLESFLRSYGVMDEEISKMTPKDAWARAEEILRKPPAAPTKEERLIEEWPKAEKGMPKDVRGAISGGEEMISKIKDQETKIKSLESAIKEWRDSLNSLRESITKTEEQIATGLLGGDVLKRANESLTRLRSELTEFEVERGTVEIKEAKIEPAKSSLEQLKRDLTGLYKLKIEPFEITEKVRKEAEKKVKETKEKAKKARKTKL